MSRARAEESNPDPITGGRPHADEVVIGMIRFRLDRPRDPRPVELVEEDLLWRRLRRRLRRRLEERRPIGVATERFAEWWRPVERHTRRAPETPSGPPRKQA
jgi:hypothetical protein